MSPKSFEHYTHLTSDRDNDGALRPVTFRAYPTADPHDTALVTFAVKLARGKVRTFDLSRTAVRSLLSALTLIEQDTPARPFYAYKCPYCGEGFAPPALRNGLIPSHSYPPPTRMLCKGVGQTPRGCADNRPLWKDDPDYAGR